MAIHPQRHLNLVRNIRNWPRHYTRKFAAGGARDYVFVTRRTGMEAHVPGDVYGIFKEMFMNATYPFDAIAARVLSVDARSAPPAPMKQTGLDDGVTLR